MNIQNRLETGSVIAAKGQAMAYKSIYKYLPMYVQEVRRGMILEQERKGMYG